MKLLNMVLEILEIDFYVGGDAKRAVDSVYNYVVACVFNFEMYVVYMVMSVEIEDEC